MQLTLRKSTFAKERRDPKGFSKGFPKGLASRQLSRQLVLKDTSLDILLWYTPSDILLDRKL
ncbi:MAG: hypothetical protein RLZZ574_1080 [Cyanobacteriota bacterium]|jgi:hypothetical protein